jgi:hypothetical protein
MRRIAIVLLVTVLPVLGQTPPPAAQATPPPARDSAPPANGVRILTEEEFQKYLQGLSPEEREAVIRRMKSTTSGPTCYFIQQVNQNLQKPKDKAEFVPLASAGAAPLGNANTNCLTDSIVRKAIAK